MKVVLLLLLLPDRAPLPLPPLHPLPNRPKAAKPTLPRKETTFPFDCKFGRCFISQLSTINSQPFSYAKD
jgi:hypothetical protein